MIIYIGQQLRARGTLRSGPIERSLQHLAPDATAVLQLQVKARRVPQL